MLDDKQRGKLDVEKELEDARYDLLRLQAEIQLQTPILANMKESIESAKKLQEKTK